jgi:hypothetical protein
MFRFRGYAGVYLLEWRVMRRVLILGLALSVVTAGLVPLSACALFSSKIAECAEVTAQSPCDQMYHHSAGAQFSRGSDKSCCVTSQAPIPELQFKGVEAGPSVAMAVPYTLAIQRPRPYSTLLVFENPSPPCLQSFLCTFLI